MQDSSYYLLLEDKSKFKHDDAPYLDLVSKINISWVMVIMKFIDITLTAFERL